LKTISTIVLSILIYHISFSQVIQLDSIQEREYFPSGKIKAEYWLKFYYPAPLLDGEFIVYYENGGICEKTFWTRGKIVGTREVYDEKGRVIFRDTYIEGDPRTIISNAFYYDFLAACTHTEAVLIETGVNKTQLHGTLKYFRRNGNLMDLEIYEYGVKIYRAHFNNKGELSYEEKYR